MEIKELKNKSLHLKAHKVTAEIQESIKNFRNIKIET